MINTNSLPITYILKLIKSWEDKYHVTKDGDIVFQNKKLMFNIFFTNKSLNVVKHNTKGLESLPNALTNPDEVWGLWENEKVQKDVILNYILIEKEYIYIVKTIAGIVENTTIDIPKNINKYRKGVLFIL